VHKVVLLACGEPMRGDDALALAVLDELPPTTLAMVDVRPIGQLMPDDLHDLDGAVIVLDAVDGPPPGTVVDMPLSGLSDAYARGLSPASSHALPLPITLGIVGQLPGGLPDGRFVGVAASDYTLGAPLSAAVRAAVPACAARVNHWVRVLAHEAAPRARPGARPSTCA
jgi:hydrogenase maturation protease